MLHTSICDMLGIEHQIDYTASWYGRNDEVIAHHEELLTQLVAAMREGNA